MFTDKLFNHKYDIDDLISAFCGDNQSKKWQLNTKNGDIVAIENDEDVDKNNDHIFIIESLPLSFLTELQIGSDFKMLPNNVQKEVIDIANSCKNIQALMTYFNNGEAGAHILKSIKGACLDWLDMRNLIPPSMRHTGDVSMLNSLGNDGEKIKIKISTI